MGSARSRWLIAGAGSIGCWLGGHLAAQGHGVTLLGRPRIFDAINQHGLTLTALDRAEPLLVPKESVTLQTELTDTSDVDVVVVCVKSKDTANLAAALASSGLPEEAIVFSAQNGIRNPEKLAAALPDYAVHPMVVAFNVVNLGDGRFHRGTQGVLEVEPATAAQAEQLNASGLETEIVTDIASRMWGKLLMNLSNPINAIADVPLREQLLSRHWRSRLAACIQEGMKVLRAAGIRPALPLPLPSSLVTRIMKLPTPLYRLVAAKSLAIDPLARSSMWEDIQASRPTEIDFINGEITTLGKELGIPTPLNDDVIAEIRALEAQRGITAHHE